MPDDLLESVERHLKPYLDLKGFARSRYEYTPEQFGDSLIMYSSNEYWFYLSKDRGQVFAEVGPSDSPPPTYNNYFDLWYIAEFLKHGEFRRDYSGSTDEQVARIAQFLLTYGDEIFTPELWAIRADELRSYIQERQGSLSASDSLPEEWARDNPLKVKNLIELLMQKAAAAQEAGNRQAAILVIEEAVRLAKDAGAPDGVLKKMREPYA